VEGWREKVVFLLRGVADDFTLRQCCLKFINLSLVISVPIPVLCLTPLIDVWFVNVIGLRPELAAMGKASLWFAVLLPPITTWGCYFEGKLIHAKRSNPVTEAVMFFTSTLFIFLYFIVKHQAMLGLNSAMCAMSIGSFLQLLWLAWRSRRISRKFPNR
jgi:Na+-driven multidrug efflux pump